MPNLPNTVTYLFASDGSLASEGLSVFLQTKANFLMTSACSDGASTIAEIEAHNPEIAVIDAQLPDMSAGQIIQAVRSKNQDTRIIVLGASADRAIADQLLAAGADAYIVRNGPSRHLNEAIRYVCDGGKYLAPQLTRDVPVALNGHPKGETCEDLRTAVEAQARTVERLEQAMDRAQYAIELLQQKVEQLSGSSIEAAPFRHATDPARMGMLPVLRPNIRSAAAALMIGIVGFMLSGSLRPSPKPVFAESSSSSANLNLTGWEKESVTKATALLRSQQYAAAEKLCRTLLKLNPANIAASRILASALFHQDRVEETADVVRSIAVPVDPGVRGIHVPSTAPSFNN
jgi:DNA-binding NarL/FixJ family response regulator